MKRLLLILAALVPLAATAQEAAPMLPDDPRAPKFREVERGFFAGLEVGYAGLLKTPVADTVKFPYAGTDGGYGGGLLIGVNAGYDVTPRFAVSLVGEFLNMTASPAYGAFSIMAVGADLRYAFVGTRDANGVERFYVYAHARGAYSWIYPAGLFGTTDLLVQGGFGIEYYTKLRHFSVGLMADALYFFDAKSFGFAVVPTLRYSF